jgi:uncharacterized tellurite resistance protein B-like protein
MFAALKSFLADLSGAPAAKGFDEDDYRVAAVALLIHVADADGMIAEAESRRLKTLVKDQFHLDADEAAALIREAQKSEREAVDFYHFTHVLKRSLDVPQRLRVVGMMWDIAFADGVVDEIEESIVWRVAELLDVPNRERVLLRQKVAAEAKERTAGPISPWKLEPSADS